MTGHPLKSAGRVVSLVVFLASCGGQDAVAPPVPTTLTASSSASASAIAGTPLVVPPSVIVKDQRGNPMAGVLVTFGVTGGGGTIAGATQFTNASGAATIGSWTLGTIAGINALSATVASLSQVTFSATGTAGAPASTTKSAGDGGVGVAGAGVLPAPSVKVIDVNGNSVGGATVTFVVASGGGSVSGGTQTTDNSGVATVGGWTLGPTVGPNTLNASVGATPTLTFTATGKAGPPATVTKSLGEGQSATVGALLPTFPTVIVTDANGNAVSDATVVFVVAGGGGSVSGATQTTNGSGTASVGGWNLGRTAGPNALTATVPSLPPVTFTATGTPGPLESVAVEPISFGILIGDTVTVRAVGRDAFANAIPGLTPTFQSTDPAASLSSVGLLTGLSAGFALLRATINGIQNTGQGGGGVSVYNVVDSVSFTSSSVDGTLTGWTQTTLQLGSSICARLFTFDSSNHTNALRWTAMVSDPTIVSVTPVDDEPQSYCFRAVRSGSVTVSGSFGGTTASKALTVP
jgi:adhesin/invasin